MKSIFSYLLFITLIVFAFSCSDINTDIVTDPEISVHESGIVDSSSPNFHSKLFTNSNMDLDQCKQCHGADYSGGSSNVNCSSDQCHPAIAVHTKNIINLTSPEFHGKFIANTNWNVSSCAQCHGTNYAGGVVSPTCNSCHENAGGPEACNTCHGDFADSTMIAPPSDLSGNIATTAKGVGAHAIHLYDAAIASTVQCFDCHPTVTGTGNFIELHADGLPAELALTGSAVSAISAPDYSYSNLTCQNTYCHGNFEFLKSESTNSWIYTADKMTGSNYSPIWNKVDGTQAACGTCHGSLDSAGNLVTALPTGHSGTYPITGCVTCHPGVVDATGKIVDATKHINGMKNVFGN